MTATADQSLVHTATDAPRSWVLEVPAADPSVAAEHFAARLSVETDPSDVYADVKAGVAGFQVIDVRGAEAYASGHVPGARHLPYRTIDASISADLGHDDLLVVYCWGPHCNAADRAAVRLAALGHRVKVMIGGIWGWEQDGYAVEKVS